jgi:hypothetical protein
MKKIALDEAAKAYWKLLFGEYGEQLVKNIPRRIKASLVANKKIASQDGGIVLPIAHVKSGDGMVIEGMYRDSTCKLMFKASLDSDCNVTEISSFSLR